MMHVFYTAVCHTGSFFFCFGIEDLKVSVSIDNSSFQYSVFTTIFLHSSHTFILIDSANIYKKKQGDIKDELNI
jgi:hypothetical protein